MIRVDVNEQTRLEVDRPRLCAAIEAVLRAEGFSTATISLAIVDDATIQSLNRRWLSHDYPTDVLSFVLEQGPGVLDGEIIVSVDTAAAAAVHFGRRRAALVRDSRRAPGWIRRPKLMVRADGNA
jgi:probable rRNA maturation factor